MHNLKELCGLNGASGFEGSVRDYIIKNIGDNDYITDNLGNIIVTKKGKSTPNNKIMLSAHMDEVGFIVTYIDDKGFIKFNEIGGVDPRVVLGKNVTVNGINGVVGTVPVHLSKDREQMPKISQMYIDIGAENKEDAEKYVHPGDYIHFESGYKEFGSSRVKAKAIDDRFGCAVLLDLLKKELPYDVTVCFVVQEEIGLRGARVAANRVNPDIAIVIESTTANDISGVTGNDKVCDVGKGAVISFMDRRTIYDKELYELAVKTASDNGIAAQTKSKIAGGNDAGSIQIAGNGVRVCAVSLPTRYIHSGSCVADKKDMESVETLIPKLVEAFGGLD